MASDLCLTIDAEEHFYFQDLAHELFPGCHIQLLANQGACSTTFDLRYTNHDEAHHKILQFRQPSFDLDIDLMAEAKIVYGAYVPSIVRHDISRLSAFMAQKPPAICYEMDVISGVPLTTVAPAGPRLTEVELRRQENLVRDYADFVSRGWPTNNARQPSCNGKVGSQIPHKLTKLAEQLPYRQHRAVAQRMVESLPLITRLPVVLNHGDSIPSNIICAPETGHLKGIVDWAEAEYLPFGTCLYGLEHLLGRLTSSTRRDSVVGHRPFIFYDHASSLRELFWETLKSRIPALQDDESLLQLVLMAKHIGTLLWYGFAWDGGAIDRVINAERDAQELVYLDAFLQDVHDHASLPVLQIIAV
ncbi:hypothetical protein FKW77_004312 [Venturia effusa]|uniref:Aminoglycoside phosphotransferase domain-containing protein n=1 Tax=Venturia effusa TaxID=50376 RepID=A0A517LPZ4_9PEZI|nr:hypothetical protein FKW77_004312 [Venturia effusa]